MNVPAIKTLAVLGLVAGLSGCFTPPAPLTQDKSGRALISGAQGAAYFQKMCYNSGGKTPNVKRAVQKDKNFVPGKSNTPKFDFYSAKHKTKSVNVVSLGDNACSVSFVTPKQSAEGAAEATVALVQNIKAKGIGGKKGGGQINLRAAKGNVVIRNIQKTTRNGVIIMLFGS